MAIWSFGAHRRVLEQRVVADRHPHRARRHCAVTGERAREARVDRDAKRPAGLVSDERLEVGAPAVGRPRGGGEMHMGGFGDGERVAERHADGAG